MPSVIKVKFLRLHYKSELKAFDPSLRGVFSCGELSLTQPPKNEKIRYVHKKTLRVALVLLVIGIPVNSDSATTLKNEPFATESLQIVENTTLNARSGGRVVVKRLDLKGGGMTEQSKEDTLWDINRITTQYGTDYDRTVATNFCESSLRHVGVFGDSGRAYGTVQYHWPTFERFCSGNYYDRNDQLECQARMFKKGLQKHWTCAT